MAAFFYFLPGVTKVDLIHDSRFKRQALDSWGLGEVLSDIEHYPDDMTLRDRIRGPVGAGDKPGVLLIPRSLGKAGASFGFHSETQGWMEAADGSGRWIGWFKDNQPTPDELLKDGFLRCKWQMKDQKGNEWAIPTARSATSPTATSLPVDYTFERGELTTRVRPVHQELFDLSGEVWDSMAAIQCSMENPDDEERLKKYIRDEEYMVRTAVKVLSVNYRVGIAEVAALQQLGYSFLNTENVVQILDAFVDRPILEEFLRWNEELKKKEKQETEVPSTSDTPPSSPNSCSGPEDGTQDIGQVAQELSSQS